MMGRTLSDLDREIYYTLRNKGMSHQKAINEFPTAARERVEKNIKMSFFESHFGTPTEIILTIVLATMGVALFKIFVINMF